VLGLLAVGLATAPAARAGTQLYQGSWVAQSFGKLNYASATPLRIPFGKLCNPLQPRCPFASTPVSTAGGAFEAWGTVCTPISAFYGATARPTRYTYGTACPGVVCPPLYRNPAFFTPGGAPNTVSCGPYQSGGAPTSAPLTGSGIANTTAAGLVTFPPASVLPSGTPGPNGLRRTAVGDLNRGSFYGYTYTYATLRNDAAAFLPGGGPGSFSLVYSGFNGGPAAKVAVKAGANQFGGVMRLLGQLTSKQCHFALGGCSLGRNDWRYDAIGASAYTVGGVVTAGYQATGSSIYYHTLLMQTSVVQVVGARFPWTTGTVSITAHARSPQTVAKRQGYDNRTPGGLGTVQLVSPVITRWRQPQRNLESGGIATLRLVFLPEPGKWVLLAAGLSLLAVLHRFRPH
jgi:hypothetical protein